jgi:ABC-type sugar transport system ATPase subunit
LLNVLKTHLIGINILELERLVSKTGEAEKRIKDKDVIILLGGTGCGKSTTILSFLGYKLKLG